MPERDRGLDRDTARDWIERWDRQQEESLPDREDRFTALIDAVAGGNRPPGPAGARPRLRSRLAGRPAARPAAARHGHRHRRRPGVARAGPRPPTPAGPGCASSTWTCACPAGPPGWAWTGPRTPRSARPRCTGCTSLNCGPCTPSWRPCSPRAACCSTAITSAGRRRRRPPWPGSTGPCGEREDQRRFPDGHSESWSAWWQAAAADPCAVRSCRRAQPGAGWRRVTTAPSQRSSPPTSQALVEAGFAEVGTLWQRGDNRLLCAVLPGRCRRCCPAG